MHHIESWLQLTLWEKYVCNPKMATLAERLKCRSWPSAVSYSHCFCRLNVSNKYYDSGSSYRKVIFSTFSPYKCNYAFRTFDLVTKKANVNLGSLAKHTNTQLAIKQYTSMKHLKISCQKHKIDSLLLSFMCMPNYMKSYPFWINESGWEFV